MTSSTYAKNFLAIDVGNTSIHFALCRGGRFVRHFRIATKDGSKSAIAAIQKNRAMAPAVIASVVPAVGELLKKNIKRKLGLPAYLIGKDITLTIKNKYKNPKQVGVDRLLNAMAAYKEHPGELIIVDFGTAITFDVVSKKGEYLGGVIAPGIEISLDAIFQRPALLPKTKLEHPKDLIGRDTVESIRVGCSVGIGGLCDRVIEEISTRYRMKPYVIATGGYAEFISRYCRYIRKIDPDLIMKGIGLAFCRSVRKY